MRLLLIIFLVGCTPTGIVRGSGVSADPPEGYVKLCAEHPTFDGCTP